MVGGTHQQPQASQLAPPPSSSSSIPAAATEEEEFLKRNTDCVYFLASPLTCKKGSECEYRHSDIARVNPRDCWYWLNGNCLNPKCGFRHPPLDGLLGAEVPPSVGPTIPQAPVTPGTPYPISKQGVPCIFFQQGYCLKGHLCPFLHGPPNILNNKVVPPVPSNNVTKPSKIAPEKPIQEQKLVQQETVQKPVEFPPPKMKQVPTPARNGGSGGGGGGGGGMEKKVAVPPAEEPRYRPANAVPPPVMNEFPVNRSNHGVYEAPVDNEGINGKDVEEYSREPTPGFDVLVDNEHGDSEYYNEEQFGRSRGHDYEMGRPVDFDVDQDMYNEQREGYAWEDHRESSERILGGSANFGRQRYPRDESPDQFDKSDLRHRISNQRRGSFGNVGGGLRSVISREQPRDSHMDRVPRRDSHHDRHHDRHNHRLEPGALSSRLRGRIKIPGGNENGSRVEREIDMGRHNRSRYSPRVPHGRIRDRVGGDFERRDYRGPRGRRDVGSDNDGEFTKRSQNNDMQQPFGKRKYSQQSEDNLSFDGPKPLSEILKRKRGGSVNNDDNNNNNNNNNNLKENNESENERKDDVKKEESVDAENGVEKKGGLIDEDALLDEELEAYDDHKDGDYDYEQIDGEEEYNLEEGEEEEYMEEEEEDGGNGKKETEVYS